MAECAKFTGKTCLVPHSDEFECQGQGSKVKVTRDKKRTVHSRPGSVRMVCAGCRRLQAAADGTIPSLPGVISWACVQFMFGKTSLTLDIVACDVAETTWNTLPARSRNGPSRRRPSTRRLCWRQRLKSCMEEEPRSGRKVAMLPSPRNQRLGTARLCVGSWPSDRYFRSVCLFVCLSVCLCRVFLSRL